MPRPSIQKYQSPFGPMHRAFISIQDDLGAAFPFDTIVKDIVKNRDRTNSVQAARVTDDACIALNDQGYFQSKDGFLIGEVGGRGFTTLGGKRKLIDIDPAFATAEQTLASLLHDKIISDQAKSAIHSEEKAISKIDSDIKALDDSQKDLKKELKAQKAAAKLAQFKAIEDCLTEENLKALQETAQQLITSAPNNWEKASTSPGLLRELSEEANLTGSTAISSSRQAQQNALEAKEATFGIQADDEEEQKTLKTFKESVDAFEKDPYAQTLVSVVPMNKSIKELQQEMKAEKGKNIAFTNQHHTIPQNAKITLAKKGFWGCDLEVTYLDGNKATVGLRGGSSANGLYHLTSQGLLAQLVAVRDEEKQKDVQAGAANNSTASASAASVGMFGGANANSTPMDTSVDSQANAGPSM